MQVEGGCHGIGNDGMYEGGLLGAISSALLSLSFSVFSSK